MQEPASITVDDEQGDLFHSLGPHKSQRERVTLCSNDMSKSASILPFFSYFFLFFFSLFSNPLKATLGLTLLYSSHFALI